MKKIFLAVTFLLNSMYTYAQSQITQYEYWIDGDYVNKVSVTVPSATIATINFNVNTSTLSPGLHILRYRTKAANNKWSSVVKHQFTNNNNRIVECEYWFDNKYNNKVNVPITSTTVANINFNANTSALDPGLHYLHYRTKSATKSWSSIVTRQFTNSSNNIVGVQYWFNNNFASAQYTSLTPAKSINYNGIFNISSLSKDTHKVSYRFKDTLQGWSVIATDSFFNEGPNHIYIPQALKVTVYPNPATQEIFVDMDKDFEYFLVAATGNVVSHGFSNKVISIENLASGNYSLLVKTNKQIYTALCTVSH
jgi:hypothetical protein